MKSSTYNPDVYDDRNIVTTTSQIFYMEMNVEIPKSGRIYVSKE